MAAGMHVISQKALREFWKLHALAEEPLRAWHRLMEKTDFDEPEAVKRIFGKKVDQVAQFTVFDIGGNKYRLITVIDFEWKKVFIRNVLTHREYDEDKWKKDPFRLRQSRSD